MAISSDPARPVFAGAPANQLLLSGNLLCVASMLTWAAAFPTAEFLLERWSPLALITARLILAITVLIPIWALIDGPRAIAKANWRRGTFVGGIGFGLGTYLILVAQDLTDPVTVALIASCAPLAGTLLEMAHGQRRATGRFLLGMSASVAGGTIATNSLDMSDLGPGAACAVVSVFLFAWGSHRAVHDFPDLTPLGRTSITLGGAFVVTTLICLGATVLGFDAAIAVSPRSSDAVPLIVYAVVCMALSQALWIASVGRMGVALASFHINIAPFYVMLIMLALGHGWDWTKATGAVIVGLGVVIAQSRPRSQTRIRPV